MRGLYFIEHSLATPQARGLYEAIYESVCPLGLRLYEKKADASPSTSLMDACQKIYLSSLGIFDLSGSNADAFLQLGISAGLNKPAFIIAGQGMTSAIPSVLGHVDTWFYSPPLKPTKDLRRAVLRTLNRLSETEKENAEPPGDENQTYCAFCGSYCQGWRKQTHGKGFLVLDGNHPEWQGLRDTIRSGLCSTGLMPIYLTQLKGRVMPLLCEMRLALLASEFVLLDLTTPGGPEQYLALGMAISMRRPWLLLTSQPDNLSYLLREVTRLDYGNEQDLHHHLEDYVLKSLYPARFAGTYGVTARLELPFWRQLEDWIVHFKGNASRAMENALQLLLVEEGQLKQRCRMTPGMVIKAGRDLECDLVIEAQSASRFHADFTLNGQELVVVDRDSTNGTFLNGTRIMPRQSIHLEIGDQIRMGSAEVVVWNEAELPEEIKQYLPESGRIVPQTIFVNLVDGLVLVNGKIPVAHLTSSEVNLLKFMQKKGGETTSTDQIAEIIYGTGQVSRMIVASFIDGLRAKIEPSPANPRFLVAVPGVGYRLRTRGGQLVLTGH